MFRYGDEGNLFYIIVKGTVGVKVPIVTEYLFTQQEFASFYMDNQDDIIIDKTEHSIKGGDGLDKYDFAEFLQHRLAKG